MTNLCDVRQSANGSCECGIRNSECANWHPPGRTLSTADFSPLYENAGGGIMRYLILLFIFIGSSCAFATPIEKNNVVSISKRLSRLESEISRVAQLPSADSKKRSEIFISIRLRRLENRIAAAMEIDGSTRLSLSHRIQEARKKVKIKETTVSAPTANGIIKGRIRDAVTTKPIGSVQVEVDIYDSQGDFISYGYVDTEGRYEVRRLSEGTYYATTYGVQEESDYIDQLYENISCYDSRCNIFNGKPITVTYAHTTSGINFNLVHGAHITGQVVDANTIAPLDDQEVDIYDSTGNWGLYAYAYSDATGFYDTGGYVTGQHYAVTGNIYASGSIYVDELYSNITCWAKQCYILGGTPIQVTTGETTSGINFSLDEGGRFSGRIVDADSNLPIGVSVDLYDSTGQFINGNGSDADGHYEIPGLVTGNYFAVAGDHYDCYHDEVYDDVPCSDEDCPVTGGTPIAVTTGQTTSGIDFDLTPFDHITGRITDTESSNPLNVYLVLYDSSGNAKRGSYTDSNGVYHIGPIDPGTYFLRTLSNRQRMDLLFNGISCFDQPCVPTDGTPIVVNEGNVTSGIDFALEPCLYCLDFENFFDYEYLPDRWTVLKPSWKISDGSLIGSSSLGKSVIIASPVFAGCSTCSVKATMKTEGGAGSALYLLGWYEDHRNTIELIMKQEAGKWILRQHVNGTIVASASAQFDIQPDVFYNVEITNNGTDLDLKVDGIPILILRPVGNLFGTVGFKVKNTTGYFGSVVVKEYKAD